MSEYSQNNNKTTRYAVVNGKLEKKLTKVPLVGDKLSYVPTLISLLRSLYKNLVVVIEYS